MSTGDMIDNRPPRKDDADKMPVYRGVLMRFPRAIKAVAWVSALGATKYEVPVENTSCLDVPDGFLRYSDAVIRHMLDEAIDGPVNIERGGALPADGVAVKHAAQAAWDALCRLEIMLVKEEDNTRQGVADALRMTVTTGKLSDEDIRAVKARQPGSIIPFDGIDIDGRFWRTNANGDREYVK